VAAGSGGTFFAVAAAQQTQPAQTTTGTDPLLVLGAALIGGLVGGVVGTVLATRLGQSEPATAGPVDMPPRERAPQTGQRGQRQGPGHQASQGPRQPAGGRQPHNQRQQDPDSGQPRTSREGTAGGKGRNDREGREGRNDREGSEER
jgi:ribonuclease E